jgi:hypothetical protein
MPAPPDKDGLLEVFKRSVPRDYHDPIAADPSYALFRGLAYEMAVMAAKGGASAQARYYLPWSRQDGPPASSYRLASCTLVLRRRSLTPGGVIIEPGQMAVEAEGRRYLSAQTVRWEQGDAQDLLRQCLFQCEVPGTLGNLDFLAVDGLLPARNYTQADQSQGRANIRARLYSITSQLVLEDTGDPAVFVPADVGLYVEILDSVFAINVGLVFKIVGHDWPGTEHPVGSGYFPSRVFLDQYPLRNPQEVFLSTLPGPVYSDLTAEALGSAQFDMLPSPGTVGDALYFLSAAPFLGVSLALSAQGVGTWALAWEWWDGFAWQPFPSVQDGTAGLTIEPGEWTVRWPTVAFGPYPSPSSGIPWAAAVRAVLGAAPLVTTSPRCARVLLFQEQVVVFDEPSPTSGGISWRLLDFREVGVEVVSMPPPTGGRDDDLMVLGDNRGVYQQPGETDTSFRRRAARLADVVSPNAINAVLNNALYPSSAEGIAVDVQLLPSEVGPATPRGGVEGFFWGVNALDLYPPFSEYPVRAVSTAAVASPPTGFLVVDGVATASNDRVLLKDQANPIENGVWIVFLGLWVRDPDWGYVGRASAAGATASEGTQAGTSWYCTAVQPADAIGVDPLPFALPDPASPASPWILLLGTRTNEVRQDGSGGEFLTYHEARGFFFVLVPYLADGEFGLGLDEGPMVPQGDLYLGPAWDSNFLDGYPVVAMSTYSAVYSSVDKIRAAGVGFTLIRTPLLETP